MYVLLYMQGRVAREYTDAAIEDRLTTGFGTITEMFLDTQAKYNTQTRFTNLAMGSMTVEEYFQKFNLYRKKCDYWTEKVKAERGVNSYLIEQVEKNVPFYLIDKVLGLNTVSTDYKAYAAKVTQFYNHDQQRKQFLAT